MELNVLYQQMKLFDLLLNNLIFDLILFQDEEFYLMYYKLDIE